ncbi:unnamed protein product [Lactuca saligna]|uniref:Uncharacterized protein n=1 Tax=Lactuca saligna TaxID=75948 RepID=A0AA35YL46_LACSI|nr:unnamed protein product [Lactuca saligna]
MLEDRSSFVSKNYSHETNPWAAYGIEGLEFRQEKQPSENNHGLELRLAYGGFPADSPPQDAANSKNISHDQSMKNDGLDLRLGSLLDHVIPPPQPVNQHEPGLDTHHLINAIGRDNSINCLIRCSRATYSSIALLNRSFREFIKSGEIYKLRHDNKVIEYWVYFSCHLAKWEAFDPSNKIWIQLPIMDTDQCFQFSDKESMAVGTELLVLGRDLMGQASYKYSLLTNSWSLGKTMNIPRCLFGSASLGQVAIFAGGVNQNGMIMDSVELYDSRSGNWEMLPSLIKPRKMCSGVCMDGKFYVIGGIGNEMKSLTCGEEYDVDVKKWTIIPNMSPMDGRGGRMAPPLVAVVGNELYAGDAASMEVKKYDKKMKEWAVIGRLPERAQSVDGWGMAFRGCGERVVVIGGPRRDNANVVEIYSWMPSKGPVEWSMIGRKRSDSFVYNCAVMGC